MCLNPAFWKKQATQLLNKCLSKEFGTHISNHRSWQNKSSLLPLAALQKVISQRCRAQGCSKGARTPRKPCGRAWKAAQSRSKTSSSQSLQAIVSFCIPQVWWKAAHVWQDGMPGVWPVSWPFQAFFICLIRGLMISWSPQNHPPL